MSASRATVGKRRTDARLGIVDRAQDQPGREIGHRSRGAMHRS